MCASCITPLPVRSQTAPLCCSRTSNSACSAPSTSANSTRPLPSRRYCGRQTPKPPSPSDETQSPTKIPDSSARKRGRISANRRRPCRCEKAASAATIKLCCGFSPPLFPSSTFDPTALGCSRRDRGVLRHNPKTLSSGGEQRKCPQQSTSGAPPRHRPLES
jgi:hypothetical protein